MSQSSQGSWAMGRGNASPVTTVGKGVKGDLAWGPGLCQQGQGLLTCTGQGHGAAEHVHFLTVYPLVTLHGT